MSRYLVPYWNKYFIKFNVGYDEIFIKMNAMKLNWDLNDYKKK